MSKLLNRFENTLSNLSYAEKHVFYYIENNLENAKKQSLTEMADENSVSTATIVRMCHKLGLSGFSELKYILKSIQNQDILTETNYIDNIKNNINLTLSNLNINDLYSLIQFMITSKKIIIVAVGLTKTIGEYFSKLLMQANKNTLYVYESHIIDLLPGMIDHEDLVIFISNSGETKTLLSIGEKLSYRNYKTAAIINVPDSSLSRYVTLTINAHSNKLEYGGYDITPRSSLLLLIDIIFGLFLEKKNIVNKK
jgi:DNA-binding MurR/RpiR family transcriptional regulator